MCTEYFSALLVIASMKGFAVKVVAESTLQIRILGSSILTNNRKILLIIKLRHKTHVTRRPTSQRIVVRISFQMTSFSVKHLPNGCAALPVVHANQICSRVLKFIDYYLASMACLSAFLQHLEDEKSIGFAGSVSYINALLETMENRKFKGVSASILSNFSVAEVFLKRASRCIARKMRVGL